MMARDRSIDPWLGWLRGIGKTPDAAPADANAAPGGDREPAIVWETGHPLEAEAVRALLESHDIPAMIQREAVSQAYPFTVGDLATCRILVPATLAAEARQLVAETEGETDAEDPREPNGSAS